MRLGLVHPVEWIQAGRFEHKKIWWVFYDLSPLLSLSLSLPHLVALNEAEKTIVEREKRANSVSHFLTPRLKRREKRIVVVAVVFAARFVPQTGSEIKIWTFSALLISLNPPPAFLSSRQKDGSNCIHSVLSSLLLSSFLSFFLKSLFRQNAKDRSFKRVSSRSFSRNMVTKKTELVVVKQDKKEREGHFLPSCTLGLLGLPL